MEEGLGRKKQAQALQALRQKKYTEKNPLMAKLSQTRKRVALIKSKEVIQSLILPTKRK